MAAKIYFPIVEAPDEDAVLFTFAKGAVMVGNELDENLACGACKTVFARNTTTRSFIGRLFAGARTQIVIQCGCGAFNVIKAKR
jgi:hypothetical protein